jgi:hypothetical protein
MEDKLLYGLTPMRLGYMVLALLGSFALWSSSWAVTPVRAASCAVVLLVGATLAWGRWQSRPVDLWLTDIAAFIARNQRIVWNEAWVDRLKRRPWQRKVKPVVPEGNDSERNVSDEGGQLAFPDAAIFTG